MATSRTATIISHLRQMVLRADGAGMTDGQLLGCFIVHRDAAAFESLVRRHGPMVLGVCHRILRDPHDAEDAVQSTFLVLARKAASVSPREMVGNWLYGVAQTTAIRLRAANAKRRVRERQVADLPEPEAPQKEHQDDLLRLLDEELARLPDKFRVPIVLCDLEGQTRREVARQLDIPEGTLSSRLTKARRMLAKRLARHGLAVSGGALAAVLSERATSACLSVTLVNSTVKAAMLAGAGQAATGLISIQVAALTEGALKAMFVTNVKTVMGAMLVTAALCGAAGLIYQTPAAEPPKAQQADKEKQPATARKEEKPRPDKERLQGTWKIVSLIVDGEELKDGAEMGHEWTFSDRTIKVKSHPKDMKTGATTSYLRFQLDEKTNPKRIDCVEGKADDLFDPAMLDKRLEDADVRKEGIYFVAGDTLILCISRQTGERPTVFESKKGSSYILMVLKKEKDTLQRQSVPKKDADEKNSDHRAGRSSKDNQDVTTLEVASLPKAAAQREYVIVSRLMEADADEPKVVLRLPKVTVDEGQRAPIHISDGPENLLAKVVDDEKIKIGTFFDVRVKRLGENKALLSCSFQKNEVDKSGLNEIRVIGNSVQAIQGIELHKPVKIVFQKDARGAAQRWVEITVDEVTAPPAATAGSGSQEKGSKK